MCPNSITLAIPGNKITQHKLNTLDGTESTELQELLERLEHRNKWHIDDPIGVGQRAVMLAKKSVDSKSTGMAYFFLANVYRNAADYPNAMGNYVAAELIFNKLDDSLMRARCCYSMGHIQFHIDEVEAAFNSINNSILFASKVEDKDRYLKAYVELGMMHMRVNELDSAERCFDLVSTIYDAERHDSLILAGMYNGMAAVALKQNEFSKCEEILLMSLDLVVDLGDLKAETVIKSNLGELLLMQGRLQDAIECIRTSMELGREINYLVAIINGHKILARVYEKMDKQKLVISHRLMADELEEKLNLE
jgi:tetratricopeptide (TPR) repeat protein